VEGGGDSHDHLLAGKQGVADELAGAQSNLSVGHFSGDGDDDRWSSKKVLVVSKQKKNQTAVVAQIRRASLACVRGLCSACLALFSDVEPLFNPSFM
jgi:hypothetical protein